MLPEISIEEKQKMKAVQAQVFSLSIIACLCLAGFATAQDAIQAGSERPMFTHLPPTLHSPRVAAPPATPLQTWNGSFTSGGTTYNYNMVGVPPFPSSSATIPTVIIPVKIVISNGATFDPSHVLSNGNTVTQNTIASPIFASVVDFTSGGADWGRPSTSMPTSEPISGTARETHRTCCWERRQ